MAGERLDLRKEVFDKAKYLKTINTSFNEFGTTTITEDLILQPTVEEFFGLYNSLFYDIPALGDINSHQSLVRTSGEYINFDEISDEITALRAEISQLRADLLKAQMENIKTQTAQTADPATNKILENAALALALAQQNLIVTETSLSNNTVTSTNGR